jgi:hypothetical protein
MQSITRERTRQFDKNKEIDCRTWLKFVIVEETYRYHRIRYTEFDDCCTLDKMIAGGDDPPTTD